MGDTATLKKNAVLGKATQAAGGKPVCDPNAPCQPCQRADLQLLVVVPSVVTSSCKEELDLASHAFSAAFDAEFVGAKRKGTVPVTRIMKQGFVFVHYLERKLWDVWQVAASGLTRKIMHQVNTSQYAALQPGFSGVQASKACSRGAANVPAQLISITGAQTAGDVWLAYSSDVWTSHTLKRYADNPEVDMPGPAYSTVKRKLRDVRGRQINATNAAAGKMNAFSLPLNTAALQHNVLDFASSISTKLKEGCDAVQHPLDDARCGMAAKFEGEVRALERALGAGLKNREQYLNTTSILMLPDALGVAEAHTHINARTIAQRQYWEAGGPDASGMNKNPERPWQRQSVLQSGYICDWVAAAEQRKADEKWSPDSKFYITKAMHGFHIDKRGTDRRVVPDSTRYQWSPLMGKYEVHLPPEEKRKHAKGEATAATAKRLARYKEHLNNAAIEESNERWKKQEDGWTALRKNRDQDYIDWLETAAFGAAVRYDFDDERAISDAKRTKEQIRVDAQEAATRLRVMARCFGGAGCSEISQEYFARQFRRDVTDPYHYIAAAVMGEFDFKPKFLAKYDEDEGTQADIYDAYLASTNAFKEFTQVWQTILTPPVSDTSSIMLTASAINARMRIMALQPGMSGKKGVAKALESAMNRSAMWVRAEGLLTFINTNQKQYAITVAWTAGAFDGASTNAMMKLPVVSIRERPANMSDKQAANSGRTARKAVEKYVTAMTPQGLKQSERVMMVLFDQADLASSAGKAGDKMVDVVSPGLFGLDHGIRRIPESWALEMTNRQRKLNIKSWGSVAGFLNIGTFFIQLRAFRMSSGDVQKTGGWDQMDAVGSLLGATAGMAGGLMELGSMLMTPSALNKAGTPFAAELASAVPWHLRLKFAAGMCLAAGAVFDSSVALAKSLKADNQGDRDASTAYLASATAEFFGGLSLGGGAYFAYRASQLDKLGQVVARQAAVRILGAAFTPLMLARCLTGIGLLLWLGGLGCSFLALYLEDDDNEVFLRRSYFGTGHPELGRFKNLDHEVESFGSLSMGTRAEMEWADRLGLDGLKITVKVYKPEPSTVVTVRLQGYDGINGKFIRHLTAGKLAPLKLSTDAKEAAAGVSTTELDFDLPEEVSAVKLSYYVYPNALKGTKAIATGDLWIDD